MFKRLFLILILLAPLFVFIVPVPLGEDYLEPVRLVVLAAAFYMLILAAYLGARLGNMLFDDRRVTVLITVVSLVAPLIVFVFLLLFKESFFIEGFALLAGNLFLFTLLDRSAHAARGILSLFVALAVFLSLEKTLRGVPDRYFLKEVLAVPVLAERERSEAVYERNGFRGKRPCRDCVEQPIRIFAMGGSSTYGLPMYHSINTYSAVLQRFLNERRPDETFEVFNAGIAGHGITQVLHSIEASILQHSPDVVSVMSWFNDSAPGPGWWGVHNKSDKDAYIQLRVLWALEDSAIYRRVHGTRLYGIFRFYVLHAWAAVSELLMSDKDVEQRHPTRMSPADFEWALEEIIKLSDRHDFLPVFIYEPLHRTDSLEEMLEKNRYYRVISDVATRYDVPIVDPLTPMSERREEWLFYDFIHPNIEGHRLIAEELYQTLFVKPPTLRGAKFLSAKKIDTTLPPLSHEYRAQVLAGSLNGQQMEVRLRAPYSEQYRPPLMVFSNGELIAEPGILSPEFETYSFEVPEHLFNKPIIDLSFKAGVPPDEQRPHYRIGDTSIISPVHLEVTSGGREYGWRVEILASGKRYDPDSRGYNVVVLDADSGNFISSRGFDTVGFPEKGLELIEYLNDISSFKGDGKPPIVIVAVHTDGAHNVNERELEKALQSLGGSGRLPDGFESLAIIGSPGAAPGAALEDLGPKLVQLEVGSNKLIRSRLLEVAWVQEE